MTDDVTQRTTEPKQQMEGQPPAENEERSEAPAELLRRVHEAQGQLTTSPYSHDALELAMAATMSMAASVSDDTALVWLMLVGAPSADKTETVRALKDFPHILYVDSLTENAFASGYVAPDAKQRKPDLLTQMNQERRTCLVIKDMTTLFSMRDEKVKQLLGDLQSIYDGEYAKATGTKGLMQHHVKFSLMACITSAALDKHHQYMSKIGSRFLFYRIPALTADERQAGFDMIFDTSDRRAKVTGLRRLVVEHLNAIMKTLGPEPESPEIREKLTVLADLLCRARADIQYGRADNSSVYEIVGVQIEEPWRAIQQLRNLARALAGIHGRSSVTDHEIELVRRVVLSAFPAGRLNVLRLFTNAKELSRKDVKEGTGQSYGRAIQLLNELVRTDLLVENRQGEECRYRLKSEFGDALSRPFTPLDHIGDLRGGALTQDSPLTRTYQEDPPEITPRVDGESYVTPGPRPPREWDLADAYRTRVSREAVEEATSGLDEATRE